MHQYTIVTRWGNHATFQSCPTLETALTLIDTPRTHIPIARHPTTPTQIYLIQHDTNQPTHPGKVIRKEVF